MSEHSGLTEEEARERIKALEREVRQTREERQTAQRRVASHSNAEVALERTARDRSALSSPETEQERARVQELVDNLVESWSDMDRRRHLVARIKRRWPVGKFADMEAALAEEAAGRLRFGDRVAEAKIGLVVPPAATPAPGRSA